MRSGGAYLSKTVDCREVRAGMLKEMVIFATG